MVYGLCTIILGTTGYCKYSMHWVCIIACMLCIINGTCNMQNTCLLASHSTAELPSPWQIFGPTTLLACLFCALAAQEKPQRVLHNLCNCTAAWGLSAANIVHWWCWRTFHNCLLEMRHCIGPFCYSWPPILILCLGCAGEAPTIAVTVLLYWAFLLLWWYVKAHLHCFVIWSPFHCSFTCWLFCSWLTAVGYIAVKSSDVFQGWW